jgi:amino acid transporter
MAVASETQVDGDGVTIGTHGMRKALSWKDGLAVAMIMPAGAVASYGYWQNSLGTWGVLVLIGVSTVIAVLQAFIVAELASMFPEKPGGIALFAHEGWKRYTNIAGPLAGFGYWFGWSVVLALNAVVIGSLLQAQFFPGATWGGVVHLGPLSLTWGFPQFVATFVIVGVWLLNVLGVRALAVSSKVLGTLLMIPLAIFMFGPFVTGHWSGAHLHYHVTPTGVHGTSAIFLIVWLYLMGWTTYGLEIVATFTPEFRSPQTDFPRALRWCTIITGATFVLIPLATGGAIGDTKIAGAGAPGPFYKAVAARVLGGGGGVIILLLCFALVLAMNSATAGGGRVLYGMARDGLTLKWLHRLNHRRVPARAMTIDLVVNIFLVFFISNPVGIYATANLGYFVMFFFVLTGFLLLRKDRANWPRPIRLGKVWLPIAALLAVLTVVLAAIGSWRTDLTGYGTKTELAIAVALLLLSVVLWAYRQRVEERHPIQWRDPTVTDPVEMGHVPVDLEPAPAMAGTATD